MKKVYYPPYKQFRCIGPECPVGCCSFRVSIFKSEEAQFGKRADWADIDGRGGDIRDYVDHDADGAFFRMTPDGKCVFLHGDGLCDIQKRCGQDPLPCVCRTYPRLIARFDGRTEYGMEPCCPVVAASVKDWNIGEFIVEGEEPETAEPDCRRSRRDYAVKVLSNPSVPLADCLRKLAGMYGSRVEVPEITLHGSKLEFARKIAAFMCWSYLLYYREVPRVDNVMDVIITSVVMFCRRAAQRDYASWWDMSVDFSRMLTDYSISIGFAVEYEDRYCDVKDE